MLFYNHGSNLYETPMVRPIMEYLKKNFPYTLSLLVFLLNICCKNNLILQGTFTKNRNIRQDPILKLIHTVYDVESRVRVVACPTMT